MLSWIHSTICIVCSVENAKTDCRNIDTRSSAFEPTYAIGKEVKKQWSLSLMSSGQTLSNAYILL